MRDPGSARTSAPIQYDPGWRICAMPACRRRRPRAGGDEPWRVRYQAPLVTHNPRVTDHPGHLSTAPLLRGGCSAARPLAVSGRARAAGAGDNQDGLPLNASGRRVVVVVMDSAAWSACTEHQRASWDVVVHRLRTLQQRLQDLSILCGHRNHFLPRSLVTDQLKCEYPTVLGLAGYPRVRPRAPLTAPSRAAPRIAAAQAPSPSPSAASSA